MSSLFSSSPKKNIDYEFGESELILNRDGSLYHLNLLPEHISEKIIAVGDPGRVHQVSAFFDKVEFEMVKREFITHTGMYKGHRITVISTGMGTDNVEIFMNELDALVNIDLKKRRKKEQLTSLKIIRIGTSGAMQPDIEIGSQLVAKFGIGFDPLLFFYQFDTTEFEQIIAKEIQQEINLPFTPYCVESTPNLFESIGQGMIEGNTISCPGFYAPQGRKLRYDLKIPNMLDKLALYHKDDFWLTNFEMETSGYYALGRLLGHEVVSVNAIIANRITNEFMKSPNKAINNLIEVVLDKLITL